VSEDMMSVAIANGVLIINAQHIIYIYKTTTVQHNEHAPIYKLVDTKSTKDEK
jgi:hypothetical protein